MSEISRIESNGEIRAIKDVTARQYISEETTRAKAAESANTKAISEETTRAKAAESANTKAISEETTRAKAAESANTKAISEETTRAKAAEANAANEGRTFALRSLYLASGALYNDTASDIERTAPWGETVTHKVGHYYLNGLGDITENQMKAIYTASNAFTLFESIVGYFFLASIRTNFCKKGSGWSTTMKSVTKGYLAYYNSKMEVALIANPSWPSDDVYCFQAGDITNMFDFCTFLKRVVGVINVTASTSGLKNAFSRCPALLSVKIKGLNQDIILKDSPLVEKDCLMYMIENANVSTAITITLHADAYARLADDTDIVALLETQPLISLVSA